MKYLRCSYADLMLLPLDYVDIVIEEVQRENRAMEDARRGRGRGRK